MLEHCARFPDGYWLEHDRDGVFPHDFHKSMAEAGWLGVAMGLVLGAFMATVYEDYIDQNSD